MTRRAFPGLVTIEHRLDVPLRHDDPGGERIALFARDVPRHARRTSSARTSSTSTGVPGTPA